MVLSQRHEWVRDGVTPEIANPDLQNMPFDEVFRRWLELLREGRPVEAIVREMPEGERALMIPQGIVSLIAVPIFVNSVFWGLLGFDNCREEYAWEDGEREMLMTAASVLGGALSRQVAEAARDEERELCSQLISNIPDVVCYKDPGGHFLRVNQGFLAAFGLSSPDEVIGKKAEDFLSADECQLSAIEDSQVLETGRVLENLASSRVGQDGVRHWLVTTKLPLRDAVGNIKGIVSISRDVTLPWSGSFPSWQAGSEDTPMRVEGMMKVLRAISCGLTVRPGEA